MTVVSGFARNFIELALARVGVGIGEAAGSPPAHSLIADYFPPDRRATALAIYASGALWKYAQQVGPTYQGAVTHPGAKAERHVATPRESSNTFAEE